MPNTLTIAFTSCMDVEADPEQQVWEHIADHGPDLLLLLGDSVYMDFSFAILNSEKPRGRPINMDNDEFALTLYDHYQKQWGVERFRNLIASVKNIGLTWDDHDFAWNNSRGLGKKKCTAVPKEKRLISHGLFLQFKQQLQTVAQTKDHSTDYPPMPSLDALLNTADQGIQNVIDLNLAKVVMLDGRTFRQDPDKSANWMHGEAQLNWMLTQFQDCDKHKIICSGSAMKSLGESWTDYRDYHWMLQHAPQNAIVLTGDIHKNDGPNQHGKPVRFYEATSSGAARPGADPLFNMSGGSGYYGILHCTAAQATVKLYHAKIDKPHLKTDDPDTSKILY